MSGFTAPNVKVPLLAVVAAGAAGAAVVMGAAAVVVAVAPNCNVLCVAGASTAGEPVLVVDGADQFAAIRAVVAALLLLLAVEVALAAVDAAGKPVRVTVALPANSPPNNGVLPEDTAGAGLLS